MDAPKYLAQQIADKRVVRFARYVDGKCTGRGNGLVLDDQACVAVLLEDCGEPTCDFRGLAAGAIVHYYISAAAPTDKYRVVDKPAYVDNQNRYQRPQNWPPKQ
jgi:hypothetical protein